MELTKTSFGRLLPQILEDLCLCHCLAFDFEFSGIFNRKLRPVSTDSSGGLTLQKRYEEVKGAAEQYQILQVGITFIMEDTETGSYSFRPYNIPLNPVMDSKLDIERVWSFQSSAMEFLLKEGFRIGQIFTEGVSYLSRKEEREAKERILFGNDSVPDINLNKLDTGDAIFVAQLRERMDEWISDPKEGTLRIPKTRLLPKITPTTLIATSTGISNYQKRLVHQVVRREYPGFVSIGRKTFVEIVAYDKSREDKVLKNRSDRRSHLIHDQKGFSWVIEALVGGDLSKLEMQDFLARWEITDPSEGIKLRERIKNVKQMLKTVRPVVIGHNLFTDLVNFHKCFMGDLPEKVEDFQQAIHALFPLVFDTKYMATHDGQLRDGNSSLANLYQSAVAANRAPSFVIDPRYDSYSCNKPEHEAGYDSFVTAQIFVRLAVQLYERRNCGDTVVPQQDAVISNCSDEGSEEPESALAAESANAEDNAATLGSSLSSESMTAEDSREGKYKFGHATRFDLLLEEDDASVSSEKDQESQLQEIVEEGKLIPRFDHGFWDFYKNKLRVYGTLEQECELNRQPTVLDN
ncbi:hypothetical protein FQN57_003717 [Myotisia sp. PD_48]|nr:hypothetical protein FQN57_003717 [Myotisia sp. PD_48]